jgi:hypothetical protein
MYGTNSSSDFPVRIENVPKLIAVHNLSMCVTSMVFLISNYQRRFDKFYTAYRFRLPPWRK